MDSRGKWSGMLAIARFNWPFFLAAFLGLLLGMVGVLIGGLVTVAGSLVVFGSGYFLIVSLAVSHWVYDRSDLYRWKWLHRALEDESVQNIVLCHSGFDEASELLKLKFPQARWSVLDHYDSATMTEASIRRARTLFPPTAGTIAAKYNAWPLADASQDLVFGLLAIHELRSDSERAEWFAEAKRCLTNLGKVVLVEHVCDFANFVAFGPGFLHFHSLAAWRRSWESGGLILDDSFRITPFVRVFVLKQS